MGLFSSTAFFSTTLGLACCLLAIKKAQELKLGYRTAVAVLSVAVSASVYGLVIYQPILFLVFPVAALYSHRAGWLAKKWAVLFTLAPLLAVKVTGLPWLAMIGLSFASFRAVDVLLYADAKQKIDGLEYIAYLFFPLTLLAGPMYRWRTYCADLNTGYDRINLDSVLQGFEILLGGIVQKFLFAAAIDQFGLSSLQPHDYSAKGLILGAVLYSAFLYFDFAGYSNMAVGIGRMLGLNLPRNFDNPIATSSPQDFWRRWHISLAEWLRDVVFMPVYMGLCKRRFFASRRLFAQNIGLFLTFFTMGIWNGLELHYIVSGVMFGSYSVVFNTMVNSAKSSPLMAQLFQSAAARFAGRIVTLILAIAALYVFSGRSPI
jgi:membrane protein involved in D-alanine export